MDRRLIDWILLVLGSALVLCVALMFMHSGHREAGHFLLGVFVAVAGVAALTAVKEWFG